MVSILNVSNFITSREVQGGCCGTVMEIILKLISFFVPVTRKVKSDHSGDLELTIFEGKKVLDTANSNYSYGTLQRVLEFALQKIDLSDVKNVLVMGLGGGSVIKSLRNVFNYKFGIVAVEIDPSIIELAAKEFGVTSDSQTEIVCSDAYEYVLKDYKKFDLIIIDLFIDNKVPEEFLSIQFWKNVKSKVRYNGSIIFNSINVNNETFELIKSELRWEFIVSEFDKLENVNRLLIARWRQEI
ncbi:MAG TPA: fused MFS/spermidine synthase [Cyclobacteriaceae bacterium]|nr:fused MFS/spermidine synthase [Cyclobacteriaceae bacterium]